MTRAGAIGRSRTLTGMTPKCVSVVWGLSAPALRRVRPDLAPETEGTKLTLRVLAENSDGAWRASAVLRDPASGLTRVLESEGDGAVRVTVGDGFTHVDADGLLSASFRSDDGAVVYARTPVLEQLGLGGGRYGLDSATIR